MYIAFRWLLFLGLVMWGLLCSVDSRYKRNAQNSNLVPSEYVAQTTFEEKKTKVKNVHRQNLAFLNYVTFIAGALVVMLYNKKKDIFLYTKQKIATIDFRAHWIKVVFHLNKTAIVGRVATVKILEQMWEKVKGTFNKIKIPLFRAKENDNRHERNMLLLRRLREIGIERNKLGQLLVATIQENKNIRMQYQLQALAKKRLVQQVQETQKIIKENRSKYLNFQQLYIVTHQENTFLKSRIQRLIKDKEEVESNLMSLVSRVYNSSDSHLKAYCTYFIVKTKKNSSATDLKTDATKSVHIGPSSQTPNVFRDEGINVTTTQSVPKDDQPGSKEIDDLIPFTSEEPKPKLRGLPGEYVWTVKDKDGIIEKLYEYDYGFNCDNGDTIRRIREYSVYHDQDCLLDIANSRSTTIIRDYVSTPYNSPKLSPRPSCLHIPSNRKFLTESPVFKNFLKNQTYLTNSPTPPLMCN